MGLGTNRAGGSSNAYGSRCQRIPKLARTTIAQRRDLTYRILAFIPKLALPADEAHFFQLALQSAPRNPQSFSSFSAVIAASCEGLANHYRFKMTEVEIGLGFGHRKTR